MKGYIQLVRPANLLIAFLSIFIGGFVTGTVQPLSSLLLACFSGALIMAGANSINDYFDIDIDRINKPQRPLPAGCVTLKAAHLYSLSLFAVGIILGSFINLACFCIALISSIFLYFYSSHLKSTVLWGNLTVAFISGLAFVYGGLAVGRTWLAIIVGIFAFFYHLGREIIKDIEDMEGDRTAGVSTLPIRYSVKVALAWCTGIFLFLIGLTLIPYAAGIFSLAYLIVVVLGVDFFLLYVIVSMWRYPESKNLGRLAVLMKVDMLMGLLAIYLGI